MHELAAMPKGETPAAVTSRGLETSWLFLTSEQSERSAERTKCGANEVAMDSGIVVDKYIHRSFVFRNPETARTFFMVVIEHEGERYNFDDRLLYNRAVIGEPLKEGNGK